MPDVLDAAETLGNLSRFLQAVEAAGIDPTDAETGPVTIVAPTDEAFEAMDPEILDALFGEPARLAELISHHTIHGRQSQARLARLPEVTALDGDHLAVAAEEGLAIEGARLTGGDVRCQDGILHTIDRVLVPPEPGGVPPVPGQAHDPTRARV